MIRDGSLADFLNHEREENEKKRRRVVKQRGLRGDVDVALWLRLISSKIQGEIENEVVALFGHARKWRKTRTYVSNTESTCRAMSRLIYLSAEEELRRCCDAVRVSSPPPHACRQRLRARYWLSSAWTTLRAFDHAQLYSRKHLRAADRIVISVYSLIRTTRCKWEAIT